MLMEIAGLLDESVVRSCLIRSGSGPTGGSGCESSSEFTCLSDRVCINKVLHCDGVAHCVDGSDERGCNNTGKLPSFDMFLCMLVASPCSIGR